MSKQRLSKNDIHSLKRLAKAVKRNQGISHSEALDQIAQLNGYRAWSHLQSETPEEYTFELLLGEFIRGQREERHLKLAIVLWENLKDRSVIIQLLSLLNDFDIKKVETVYFDFRQKNPASLIDDIYQARFENLLSFHDELDRDYEKAECYFEKKYDEIAENEMQFELEGQLGSWLAILPIHTQETILDFSFKRPDNGSAISLNKNIWFYQEYQERVDQVLQSVGMLYECPNFRDDQILSQWLITAYPYIGQDLCPLDALWHDGALVYLKAFAEETTETEMIDFWVREPEAMPAKVRHLLVSKDVARANLPALREAHIEMMTANLAHAFSRIPPVY